MLVAIRVYDIPAYEMTPIDPTSEAPEIEHELPHDLIGEYQGALRKMTELNIRVLTYPRLNNHKG